MYGFFFILSYSAARYRDSFSNVFYMYLSYNCKNYLKVFYDIIYDGVGTVFYIKSRRLGNDFDFFFFVPPCYAHVSIAHTRSHIYAGPCPLQQSAFAWPHGILHAEGTVVFDNLIYTPYQASLLRTPPCLANCINYCRQFVVR